MYVMFVTGRVKPERLEEFLVEMRGDCEGAVRDEPGCLRFDVVQDRADPTRLCLYEIYRDRAAFDEHLKAPHFIKWRDAVKDWYLEPMSGYHCDPFFLTEDLGTADAER